MVDTRLGAGRRATPDRVSAHYLDLEVARWCVLEAGVPVYDIVMNTRRAVARRRDLRLTERRRELSER